MVDFYHECVYCKQPFIYGWVIPGMPQGAIIRENTDLPIEVKGGMAHQYCIHNREEMNG
jgi:hypothetical protein